MFCPHCGKEMPEGSASCPNCSQPIAVQAQAPPPAPAAAGKTSGLAIASLVLGILGICSYGLLGALGLILGIVSLRKINRSQGQIGGKGLAIAGIATGAATLFLGFLLMTAIAVPNFLMFQKKAKQSEAKANLGAIYSAQVSYLVENNSYAATFDELEWGPEGPSKYFYYLSPDEVFQGTSGVPADLPYEIESIIMQDIYVGVAVGNLDNDDTLDVWAVDTDGQISNLIDDVNE